jgi:hypothetical protein
LFNRLALGSIEAAAAIGGAKLPAKQTTLTGCDTNDTKSSARNIPTIPMRFRLVTVTG